MWSFLKSLIVEIVGSSDEESSEVVFLNDSVVLTPGVTVTEVLYDSIWFALYEERRLRTRVLRSLQIIRLYVTGRDSPYSLCFTDFKLTGVLRKSRFVKRPNDRT